MSIPLIKLLSDGEIHSGPALAAELGVSRAAVWKQLQKLESSYGLSFETVKGRGYRLFDPVELLEVNKIAPALSAACGKQVPLELLPVIDSTSAYLSRQLSEGELRSGHTCIAEYQTGGRGRRGRVWVSPFARNLYFSVYWRFDLQPAQIQGLSLLVALAMVRVLHRIGLTQAGLKWPNDIWIGDAKLAGVLIDLVAEHSGPCDVITGIGVNLSAPDLEGVAVTGVLNELGKPVSRNRLLADCLQELVSAFSLFDPQMTPGYVKEWQQYDCMSGREVRLISASQEVQGLYKGLDENGCVQIQTSSGLISRAAGELSLRPVENN